MQSLREIEEGIEAAKALLEMLEHARFLLQIGRPTERRVDGWQDKYALDAEFDT